MTNKALAMTLTALLAILPAAQALGQTATAKPAGMVVQSGEPKTPKTAQSGGKKSPAKMMNEDARHCLDLGSTAEIVKCAEPYRY